MPWENLSHSILLPELRLTAFKTPRYSWARYFVEKSSAMEVCPKCATPSQSIYDHRSVVIKDAPIRGQMIFLEIRKRRFWCKPCCRPFTEPVPGIRKGSRTTERFKREILWACETFVDLTRVQRAYRVSAGYVFKTLYQRLDEKLRMRSYPWPSTIGIDEHSFRRLKGRTEFASILVDYPNKRIYECAQGKTTAELSAQLGHIPGRENVKNVILDLCDPFKNFAREFFPNAKLVADKFHVLRLITPALIKKRYEITGTRADARARRLLTCSSHNLDHWERQALWNYLEKYPDLQELYRYKEILHRFYRTRGFNRASAALTMITDRMAGSLLPEIKTLRQTLVKWRTEILAYFETGLTNGRTEGYNNLAKLVQKRAFGYKSFRNYRLRLLSACA
jgi:transposase